VILYYTEHIYLKGIFCSKLSGRVTKSAGGFGKKYLSGDVKVAVSVATCILAVRKSDELNVLNLSVRDICNTLFWLAIYSNETCAIFFSKHNKDLQIKQVLFCAKYAVNILRHTLEWKNKLFTSLNRRHR